MTAAIQTISLEGLTRADWLKLRRRGIGGSDVAAIIGISKWRIISLYLLSHTPFLL